MGSDSGRDVVLRCFFYQYDFQPNHCEVLGKTGIRRIAPGEVLAVDPQGRALMIAPAEKQRTVYATS